MSKLTRIRPGLYKTTFPTIDGHTVNFTIERSGPETEAHPSDYGFWAVHVGTNLGEPVWATLRDAVAYIRTSTWYMDPVYGVCVRPSYEPDKVEVRG